MRPKSLKLVCHSEYCVFDDEAVFCTLAQQQEAIGVQITCAMSAEHSFPATVIMANLGVEVSQKHQLVIARDTVKYRTEVGIELLNCLFWAGKGRCVCTDDCCVPVVAEG